MHNNLFSRKSQLFSVDIPSSSCVAFLPSSARFPSKRGIGWEIFFLIVCDSFPVWIGYPDFTGTWIGIGGKIRFFDRKYPTFRHLCITNR